MVGYNREWCEGCCCVSRKCERSKQVEGCRSQIVGSRACKRYDYNVILGEEILKSITLVIIT